MIKTSALPTDTLRFFDYLKGTLRVVFAGWN